MLIYISIFLFLISGCSNDIVEEPSPEVTENEEVVDYNTFFESVILTDEENYEINRIELNGDILDVVSQDKVLSTKDSDIIIYNINSDDVEIIAEDAWEPKLSEDKSIIIFQNDNGINKYEVDTKETSIIYEIKDEIVRNYIISNDNKHIFLQTLNENEYTNYLITIGGKVAKVVLNEDDNFIITDLINYSGNNLFSLAEIIEVDKESGEKVNKTSDIVIVDFSKNNLKNLTNFQGDNTVRVLDTYEDYILVEVQQRVFQGENIVIEHNYYKVNTTNSRINEINDMGNPNPMKVISSEDEYVFLKESSIIDPLYPEMEILKYKNGKNETEIAKIMIDIPDTLFYYKEKIYIYSNNDVFIISKKNS